MDVASVVIQIVSTAIFVSNAHMSRCVLVSATVCSSLLWAVGMNIMFVSKTAEMDDESCVLAPVPTRTFVIGTVAMVAGAASMLVLMIRMARLDAANTR